jgi:nicotinamide mononucleotide (NMN) deamidase PncC
VFLLWSATTSLPLGLLARLRVTSFSAASLLRRAQRLASTKAPVQTGGFARCPASFVAAITGVAGPEADEDGNPVELIFVAVAARDGRQRVEKHEFGWQSGAAMRAAFRLLDELLTAHVP